jgi:RNA polymerase sigma-70 factor (ECF subfamily)
MPNPAGFDTDELLDRAARGDLGARSVLLDRHRDQLRQMVGMRLDRRLLSRLDPSDIVQEALAEAALKLSDYIRERPVPFYPWLRRLAWEHLVRLHEQHFKAQRRSVAREAYSLPQLPDESITQLVDCLADHRLAPDRRLIEAELKSRVLAGLSQLPDRDREILVLRYLEQLSNAEIAAILGLTEGAVRTRHTRALARLITFVDRDLAE